MQFASNWRVGLSWGIEITGLIHKVQVNCLTEVFFEDAIARAKYLDEYLAREGKPLGPFHGLPISIKV